MRIATRRAHPPWPANLQARAVDHAGFLDLLARSDVVCLPLVTGTERSMGQQSYLNAMLCGKPVVVTDATGVRDHVDPDEHALVVAPDPAALRTALEAAFAGGPGVQAMARRGQALAQTRTVRAYNAQLTAIARAARTAEAGR